MAGEFFTAEPPGKPLSSLAQGNLLLGDKDEKSTDWPNSLDMLYWINRFDPHNNLCGRDQHWSYFFFF